ncbi:hypothetical protein PQX77_013628 [Marasmius sp. AFHP31]|nr:hypothetical protein PQX77_013628 [Marasmius sp. AFHP31]
MAVANKYCVGVNSGGCVSHCYPLSGSLHLLSPKLDASPAPLPPGAVFVCANSLVISDKAVTAKTNYKLRVVGTLAAARILARHLNLPIGKDEKLQLREVVGRLVSEAKEEGEMSTEKLVETLKRMNGETEVLKPAKEFADGQLKSPRVSLLAPLALIFYRDDFYLFEEKPIPIPRRVERSSFNDNFDLLGDLLRPSNSPSASRGARTEPFAELASEKSGIKLVFDTNQTGMMFYTNIGASPAKGARKKIHGGSGIKDHGDGYPEWAAAFLEFHEPLHAFLDPAKKDKDDTLLTSDELYNNYVRLDVRFKEVRRK